MENANLIIPAFIAGLLTFLAPCTLPLVPGYLGFISGVNLADLGDPAKAHLVRRKIFYNGLLYVIGFSAVFVLLGSLFGLGGSVFIKYREVLGRIGGIFVILFGLYMLNIFSLPVFNFLNREKRLNLNFLKPGRPASSFAFGAAFAFGWTPCVGPVLGSILFLASASGTVAQGAFLLAVFSLGLAVPFLLIAAGIGSASRYLGKIIKYLRFVSIIGGAFLVYLGYLLFTDQFGVWLGKVYEFFDFLNYDKLLNFF